MGSVSRSSTSAGAITAPSPGLKAGPVITLLEAPPLEASVVAAAPDDEDDDDVDAADADESVSEPFEGFCMLRLLLLCGPATSSVSA